MSHKLKLTLLFFAFSFRLRKQIPTESNVVEIPNNNLQITVADEGSILNVPEPNFVPTRSPDVASLDPFNFVPDADQNEQINLPDVHDRNEERIDQPQDDQEERIMFSEFCCNNFPDLADRARLWTPLRPAPPVEPVPRPMRNQIQERDRSPPDNFDGRLPALSRRNRNPRASQPTDPAGDQEQQPPVPLNQFDLVELPNDIQVLPEDNALPDTEPPRIRKSFLLLAFCSLFQIEYCAKKTMCK